MRRDPQRSARAPVSGAENADEYVRKPRNSPEANVLPPSARMWNGAVGSSWNAERKTVKVKPHITKKRGVKRRSGANQSDFSATTGSRRLARHAGTALASSATSVRPDAAAA